MAQILKLSQKKLAIISPFFRAHNSTRSLETLAYEEIRSNCNSSTGEQKPYTSTALIIHGLLGSGRNWKSFSRSLVSSIDEGWRMVLVDLRNHGKTAVIEGFDPPHNLANAAQDLANLIKSKGWAWPDVIIGHSLGGKVALQYAQSCIRGDYGETSLLPKQLWVLDSVPGKVNSDESSGEVEKVLETLQSLPSSIPSRKWLVDHMIKLGFSKSLSEWMGTNLKKSGDHETWAFNIQAAHEMFNSYRKECYWSLLEDPPKGLQIGVVRAENSDRWHPEIIERLESLNARSIESDSKGKVSFHVLPKSGHWVHVDNPKGLLEIIAPKIKSRSLA